MRNRWCLKVWRDSPGRLGVIVDKEGILPYATNREGETEKSNDLCSS